MKKLSDYTIIGKIINTRGVRGEVKVMPITSVIERFSDLKVVYIDESLEEFEIEKVSYNKGFVFLKFKNFDNINDILRLKEKYIYISDEDRIELDENTFFISDIVDCLVYDMENNYIGKVTEVIENPVNDLFVIDSGKSKSLVPHISQFVKDVDIDTKTIIIDPIEGLIK